MNLGYVIIYYLGIDTLRKAIDEITIRNVARTVKSLKYEFTSLVTKFRRISHQKNVYIEDLIAIIRMQLVDHRSRNSPEVIMYLQQIDSLYDQSIDKYYDFLIDKGFLSYLNYSLLFCIAEVLGDKSLKKATNGYQSHYKRLLKEPTIKEMMHVFTHDRSLCPNSIIGLPEIIFDLDNSLAENSFATWNEYYHTRFLWASSTSLQQIESKCIRLQYAILPCVYDDILDDIHNEQVVKELKKKNITLSVRMIILKLLLKHLCTHNQVVPVF